uniref:CSON013295 protein n=1 Tax=Culicoides sonorensis TaxID=179676 RepID=A0A336MD46_CULSO
MPEIIIFKNSTDLLSNSLSADILFFAYPERPRKCTKRLLHIFDTIISLFVISPLVIAHWRGTWNIVSSKYFKPTYCFIIGSGLHVAFTLLREILHAEFVVPEPGTKKCWKRKLRRFFITKAYTYCFSVGCIMQWRGGWDAFEEYFGKTLTPAILTSIILLIPLMGFRGLRNLLSAPMIIITDRKEFTFSFPTRFRTEGSRDPGLYVLDCLFSVLVIGTLVVFVWRGLWVFLDLELFPNNPIYSSWGSVLIGYSVVAVTFALQPVMKWTCDRLDGWRRVAAADIFLFFSFIGTINVWRGVWHVLDNYFLTDDKLLGDWITHGVSMILLILLNCSNSVLVRGVYIDAEEPAGQCVIFPVYYIRLFFQKERTKKQKRLLETLERQEQNNINLLEKPHNNNFNAKIVKSNNNRIINTNTHDRKSISLEQQELLTKITVEVDGNENIENQKNNEVKALSKENFAKE